MFPITPSHSDTKEQLRLDGCMDANALLQENVSGFAGDDLMKRIATKLMTLFLYSRSSR